jgi:uncharacterized membrane protein YdcZ (DUF606 family)
MKSLGIIFIIAGVLMFILGNITFTRKEKVVDAGPVEITRKEQKTITWPNYAGAILIVAGVIVLFVPDRKRN